MWIKKYDWLWIDDGAYVDETVKFKQGKIKTSVNWGVRIQGIVEIGEGVLVGHNATIVSASHGIKKGIYVRNQRTTNKKIIIEDDVYIGAGAIILGGNILKKGCVIGAGAVLTEDHIVGEDEIWIGIPAIFMKKRA